MTCEDTHLRDLLGLKTLKAGREQGPAGSQQWTLEGYSRDGLLQGTFPGFQVKYFLDLIASVTSDLKLSVPFELSPITIPFSLLVPVLILCVSRHSVTSDSLWPHGLQPTGLLCSWNSPGKNAGVGSHFLLQGIFLTQRSNPGLLHCRLILYCLSHQGSPPSLAQGYCLTWQLWGKGFPC